ncbi:hypothetical protein COO60DRAFT_513487 [Scenedesmus sp. NREL 46B-D3]|nr:hypothetical protein COO60DRAFT_513487 [Scenedesmus sp. NREL 46B-D3]
MLHCASCLWIAVRALMHTSSTTNQHQELDAWSRCTALQHTQRAWCCSLSKKAAGLCTLQRRTPPLRNRPTAALRRHLQGVPLPQTQGLLHQCFDARGRTPSSSMYRMYGHTCLVNALKQLGVQLSDDPKPEAIRGRPAVQLRNCNKQSQPQNNPQRSRLFLHALATQLLHQKPEHHMAKYGLKEVGWQFAHMCVQNRSKRALHSGKQASRSTAAVG